MEERKEKDDVAKWVREKFYFKLAKECLKEKSVEIKRHQDITARKVVIITILAIVAVELLEVIKSLLIYANIINAFTGIKNWRVG